MDSPIDHLIKKVKENPSIFDAESIDAFTVLIGLYSKLKYRPHLFINDLIWIKSFIQYIDHYSTNEKTRQLSIDLVKLIK